MILSIVGRNDVPHLGANILPHLDVSVRGEVVIEKDGVVVEISFFILLNKCMHLLLL